MVQGTQVAKHAMWRKTPKAIQMMQTTTRIDCHQQQIVQGLLTYKHNVLHSTRTSLLLTQVGQTNKPTTLPNRSIVAK